MPFSSQFFLDIEKIHIAHKCMINSIRKCVYPQGRGSYGVVFALEGSAEYRFSNGENVAVSKGDFLFLSPDSAYTIATQENFYHYTVNFDIHKETSLLGALSVSYMLLHNYKTEQLECTVKRLVSLWKAKERGYEMRAVGTLYELMTMFYFDYIEKNDGEDELRLRPAKEYIEQHFDTEITLEKLARLTDMSVTNFRREWSKQYAETPMQYRDTIRIYYAGEYLSSGFYTVSEVSKKCGFEDVSYFVRFFKKKTGVTPGKLKKY